MTDRERLIWKLGVLKGETGWGAARVWGHLNRGELELAQKEYDRLLEVRPRPTPKLSARRLRTGDKGTLDTRG